MSRQQRLVGKFRPAMGTCYPTTAAPSRARKTPAMGTCHPETAQTFSVFEGTTYPETGITNPSNTCSDRTTGHIRPQQWAHDIPAYDSGTEARGLWAHSTPAMGTMHPDITRDCTIRFAGTFDPSNGHIASRESFFS